MSTNDDSSNESNGEYECPVNGCEYTGESKGSVGGHFGAHDDDVVKNALIECLNQWSDSLEGVPSSNDMDDSGPFSAATYQRHFGSWNGALEVAGITPSDIRNHSKEGLLDELQRISEEIGRTPTIEDMNEMGMCSIRPYITKFGSWNAALTSAGVEPNKRGKVSDEELMDALYQLSEDLDKAPTAHDMNESGDFHAGMYRRFGSWNEVLESAGFGANHRTNIPDKELLGELRRLAEEIGRTPTGRDMHEEGAFSRNVYPLRFGSWNSALQAAGFEPNERNDIATRELIEELQRLADELNRTPIYDDMNDHGRFSTNPYENCFETWNDALKSAGLEPRTHSDWVPSGEDHPRWNGGLFPYGRGWNEEKKELVRERDNRECQSCGRSESEHTDLFGKRHSVHHIQKARSFDNPERRNRPSNLVTLCETKECHRKWERMSPLRPQIHDTD